LPLKKLLIQQFLIYSWLWGSVIGNGNVNIFATSKGKAGGNGERFGR
jgi:hypothetical protein